MGGESAVESGGRGPGEGGVVGGGGRGVGRQMWLGNLNEMWKTRCGDAVCADHCGSGGGRGGGGGKKR
jgi:hypothetical protein